MVQDSPRMQYSPYIGIPHQSNMQPQNIGRAVSSIDPRYLSAYETPTVTYGQQNMPRENSAFTDYQSRVFVGPDRVENKHYPQHPYGMQSAPIKPPAPERTMMKNPIENQPKQNMRNVANIKQEVDLSNEEGRVKTRSDKLKELHKIGTKVFSGPVEKILKWNRAVQEIGAAVLFEIVGKCVSIRPEHPSSKALVVRDENGPAMQVVYHEIDFLLPELTVPCMVRVIGRMKPGTCRLQAFSVRAASGDDIATLPRRAAVAAHHVAKLCKDFRQN
ncbi:uncharacterized protein LOC121733017 [Aricia agestis]|uniref:uncharacterized protein LOC121733017 n=1 Tax=Aricia agestis TaxID=91739 RepID=UPI001C20C1F9|nr:uncharacterized protein LOC121733017 [Aricia agestis]